MTKSLNSCVLTVDRIAVSTHTGKVFALLTHSAFLFLISLLVYSAWNKLPGITGED